MKNKWLIISIISGFIGFLVSYLLTAILEISIIIGVLLFVLVIINNPKKRFMKVFSVILSMFVILNHFAFKIIGKLFGFSFNVESNMVGNSVSITLLVLACIALILDYFERKDKLTGTIFESNKNIIKDISGDNIHIHQHIDNTDSNKDV